MKQHDLVVIGAGPSGMAMATECARSGMSVLLLDEQPEPGGQIYRAVTKSRLGNSDIFTNDYWRGATLASELNCDNLTHVKGARVWYAQPPADVWFSVDGRSAKASAKNLAIAVGARERPVAIPGWTLPGVFSVGAAQVLLKSAAVAADGVVLAGSGPLLYLVAAQYVSAGKKIKALLDTTPSRNYQAAVKMLPRALIQGQFYKGIKLLARIRLAGIPVHNGVEQIQVIGKDAVQAISWNQKGTVHKIECDAVLLHEGLVPNVEFAVALGCDTSWSPERFAWEINVDESGETSLQNVYAVGDCARIVGADVSEILGRIAGLSLVHKFKGTDSSKRVGELKRRLKRHMQLRSFLDRLYAPGDENILRRTPDTVVCRCENVTVGTLEDLIEKSQGNLNFVKSLTRCGMGPCQGRMCSHSVAALGRMHQINFDSTSHQRLPLAPITIGELAALEDSE